MERQPSRIRGMIKAVVARSLPLGAEIREEAYRAYGILKGPSILDRMGGHENTPTNV
jgi:hypothetical protein